MSLLNVDGTSNNNTLTITEEGTYEITYNLIVNITDGGEVTTSVLVNNNPLAGTSQTITTTANNDFALTNSIITTLDPNDNVSLGITGDNKSGTVEEASFTVKKLN